MKTYTFDLMKTASESGFMPTMQTYILDENDDGPRPMIVICPGGGYYGLAENWEGERVAMAFVAAGFHAAVVNYCTYPNHYPLPQQNAAEAIRICREHSKEWQVNPQQVVICGFSAGGHLAASINTLWNRTELFSDEEIENGLHRPNAAILCYPVISSGDKAHKDSFINLLGTTDESIPEWSLLSLENQVSKDVAPTFLWHTFEDTTVPVENSMYYAAALREHNIPFELHIYPTGHHGLSMGTEGLPRTKPLYARNYDWMRFAIDWVSELFGLL